MKTQIKTKQVVIRNTKTNEGDNNMKANKLSYQRFISGMALAIVLLASALPGRVVANASANSEEDITTTRHMTMVYEEPETTSRVEAVLMPSTEVSLAGRSPDGNWLALGIGWIQKDDVQINGSFASLPVMAAPKPNQTFLATTRHMTMVYETPKKTSRVETMLMPSTEVSLAGRSADGEWLALGRGWVQAGDVRTQIDLAALPILNIVSASESIARSR